MLSLLFLRNGGMRSMVIDDIENKYDSYLRDESKLQGWAENISFPKDMEEIVQIVKWCTDNKIPMTIQGSRTGLAGGAVPEGGHVISLCKYNKIGEHVVRDGQMFLTVEAGVTLQELESYLNRHNVLKNYKWIPSPTETTATVGGVLSNGAKGINWYHYGDSDQYVDCMKVILEKGCVEEYKKNEIVEVIGSEGKKGIIAEVTLILMEKQSNVWGLMFFFEKEENGWSYVDKLQKNKEIYEEAFLSAVESFDRKTIELIEERKATITKLQEIPDINPRYEMAVYFEIEGSEEGVEEIAAQLLEEIEEYGGDVEKTWALSGEWEIEKMRMFRHAAPEVLGIYVEQAKQIDERIYKLSGDFMMGNESFVDIMGYYRDICKEYNLEKAIFGHAGNNAVQLNLLTPNYDAFDRGIRLFRQIIKDKGLSWSQLSFEQGIGKIKRKWIEE